MGKFFYKLLLNLEKCNKTFQNKRITLFDQWRDSCYIMKRKTRVKFV